MAARRRNTMASADLSPWTHPHVFDEGNRAGELGTRRVGLITAAMMLVEIWAGWCFNSMALLADGWHMSSHALGIGLSALAYRTARRYAHDKRFAFGTWKIEVLAGFTSALFLLAIAAWMAVSSVQRLITPGPIRFNEAIAVAAVGLLVNVLCALILARAQDHAHDRHLVHQHHDLNLRSAYVHVIADAATSVLAVVALLGGLLWGWNWLDPTMGIVGAVLIALWARGLLRGTSSVLLDREMDHPVVDEIRRTLGEDVGCKGTIHTCDLHVWRVGREKFAVIVGLVTDDALLTPDQIRQVLARHVKLAHISIEIHWNPEPLKSSQGQLTPIRLERSRAG